MCNLYETEQELGRFAGIMVGKHCEIGYFDNSMAKALEMSERAEIIKKVVDHIQSCMPKSPMDNSGFAMAVERFYKNLRDLNNKLCKDG